MSEEEKTTEAEESTEEKEDAAAEDSAKEDTTADDSKEDADESEDKAAPPKKKSKKAKTAATPAKPKKAGAKKKPAKASHPRTSDMIAEALENLADRKGSSVQAIKSYILSHFKTVRPDMIKAMMRRALTSGLDQGLIGRPKGQVDSRVLSGRYVLKKGKSNDEIVSTPKSRPPSLRQPKSLQASKKGKKGKKARRPVAKKVTKKAKSPAKKKAKK